MLVKYQKFDENGSNLVCGFDIKDFLKRKEKLISFPAPDAQFYFNKNGKLVFKIDEKEVFDYELKNRHICIPEELGCFIDKPKKGEFKFANIEFIFASEKYLTYYKNKIVQNIKGFFKGKNRYIIPLSYRYFAVNQYGTIIYSVDEVEDEEGVIQVSDWINALSFRTPLIGSPFEEFERMVADEKNKLREAHDEEIMKDIHF